MSSPLTPFDSSVNADWTLELNVYNYDTCRYDRKTESFSAPENSFPQFRAENGFITESLNVYTHAKIITIFGHFQKDYDAYMSKFDLSKGKKS